MKLRTINRVLRCFGIVLVVWTGEGVPIRFYIGLARHYDTSCL